MLVLGIDPGLRITGYAAVRIGARGDSALSTQHAALSSFEDDVELVEAGVFRLDAKLSVADRLVELDRDLRETLGRLRPEAVAVEKLYAHYKHPTTAITMGHARGVIFLAVRQSRDPERSRDREGAGDPQPIPLIELASTEVKKSLTGNGHASKRQMQDAVQAQLRLTARPEPADVADAIAIALCAARRQRAVAVG